MCSIWTRILCYHPQTTGDPQTTGNKALHMIDVVCVDWCYRLGYYLTILRLQETLKQKTEEKTLHILDVVYAVWQSNYLIVLPEDPRKGHAAFKSTIAPGFCHLMSQVYILKSKVPPFSVTASVGASRTFWHQVAQVCKATTWSSVYTFLQI